MEKALKELEIFLNSNTKVTWLCGDTISVYVRKSLRFIDKSATGQDSFQQCLDISNIQVDEEHQGKGIFKSFMNEITVKYSHMNIYVESILNPIVEKVCLSLGFEHIDCIDVQICMIKRKTLTFESLVESAPLLVKRKLVQLKFLRERPDFHPEPSTHEHIKIVTKRLESTGNIDLIIAGILHDICKFDTVKENPKTGFPQSPGHEEAAFELIISTSSIIDWIFSLGGNWLKVANIVKNHGRIHQLDEMKSSKRLKYIQEWKEQEIWESLQIFGEADDMLKEFDLQSVTRNILP
jgi:hypothetical protein